MSRTNKGKKADSAGTSSTTGLPVGWKRGDWLPSAVTEPLLEAFAREGLIPAREIGGWRAPVKENKPAPRPHERVVHIPFIERGFSLPPHDFVRGLLNFYGIQLHHLTPNGVLHIACFITLCECYLGTRSHWGLWKHLFIVKA